jgi:ubiquinone/menaquinone biosynthesis C-methylase UbiE
MTNRFYDLYWTRRGNRPLSDFDYKWPFLERHIPRGAGITILDFGCGAGGLIRRMMNVNPSASYIGLDVSGVALDAARSNAPEADFHLIDDGEPFPLGDRSVDFIITSEVIEHVYDTTNAFSEMHRVLQSGGRLLITAPYHGTLKNILIALFSFDRHYNPTDAHIRFFTKRSITACLRQAGFTILELRCHGRWYPVCRTMLVLAGREDSPGGREITRPARIS